MCKCSFIIWSAFERQLPKRIVYFTCSNATIGSVIIRLRLIFVSECGKQHGLNSARGHLQLIMFNYLHAPRGYQMFSAPPSPSAALLTGQCLSSAGWQSPPYVWPHFCSTSYLFGTSCWRGVSGFFFIPAGRSCRTCTIQSLKRAISLSTRRRCEQVHQEAPRSVHDWQQRAAGLPLQSAVRRSSGEWEKDTAA